MQEQKKCSRRKTVVLSIIFSITLAISLIFLFYTFSWRIGGFSSCVDPNEYIILKYDIEEDNLTILYEKGGFYSTPTLGYILEDESGILKIGLKYRNGYIAYLHKGSKIEQLVIPFKSDSVDKIILCGGGNELELDERYDPEAYESIKEYIS